MLLLLCLPPMMGRTGQLRASKSPSVAFVWCLVTAEVSDMIDLPSSDGLLPCVVVQLVVAFSVTQLHRAGSHLAVPFLHAPLTSEYCSVGLLKPGLCFS